jgi:hypothetical protein
MAKETKSKGKSRGRIKVGKLNEDKELTVSELKEVKGGTGIVGTATQQFKTQGGDKGLAFGGPININSAVNKVQ